MNKVVRRIMTVIPAAALQVLWMLLLIKWLSPYTALITLAMYVTAFFLVLYIIIKRDERTYKILWLLVILTFPLPGTLLYLFLGNKRTARPLGKRLEKVKEAETPRPLCTGGTPFDGGRRMERTFRWLEGKTGYPMTRAGQVRYYALGDDMLPDMLEDMKRAQSFIYLEYFIIEPGVLWDSIAAVLEEKAAQGLDVRVMYDDLGSISTFNMDNVRQLRAKGIKCVTFNPLVAVKGTVNYRDHRKMLIVDGETAYSGGVNLADRYANLQQPYGHWKDNGFRVVGEPVRSFTHMFLTFWNAFSLKNELPAPEQKEPELPLPEAENGYMLSYYDSPLNREATSNQLYIDLLSQSADYAWFFTPYLMPGDELLDAMAHAAHRGVDVRIIMPGIPDKKFIFRMSRSFYQTLLTEGVKIYEYTPGFIHAKSFVSDDAAAVIGTVNLDYRSLFLHFENNSLFYRSDVIAALKDDFLSTQAKCRQVQPYAAKHYAFRWIVDGILHILAPLC